MTFFVSKLRKYDIVQKLSISIDNVFECITVELCLKQKIYVSCVYNHKVALLISLNIWIACFIL